MHIETSSYCTPTPARALTPDERWSEGVGVPRASLHAGIRYWCFWIVVVRELRSRGSGSLNRLIASQTRGNADRVNGKGREKARRQELSSTSLLPEGKFFLVNFSLSVHCKQSVREDIWWRWTAESAECLLSVVFHTSNVFASCHSHWDLFEILTRKIRNLHAFIIRVETFPNE